MEIEELYTEFSASAGIETDTRKDLQNKIFFGLKGPNFDGNQFALQALAKGAALAVVDDETLPEHNNLFFVTDALKALQSLARHHRQTLKVNVIAICGSNGKTTTKELMGRVLAKRFKTFVTPGNLNNPIGVPLSILQITHSHEMAVIEIGANHLGETAELCLLANPDFGLITNVGKDHLEGFGSIEGVAQANGELFQHLQACKGLAFVNTTDEHVVQLASKLTRKVTYPQSGDFFSAEAEAGSGKLVVRLKSGRRIETKLVGSYNLPNVAAAMCAGTYFDVAEGDASEAVADYNPTNMRSQLVATPHNEVIVDAYNANPSSMLAALKSFSELTTPKTKVAILGEMAELGKYAELEHRELGHCLRGFDIAHVYLIGDAMQAARVSEEFHFFANTDVLEGYLKENPLRDSLILLKGSRANKLERLLTSL